MLTVDNVKVARDILLRSYNYCRNRLDGCCSYLMQEEDESGTEYKCAYYGNGHCEKGMLDDAIELLKEQEQAMKEKDGTISNLIAQIKEISQCYERVVRCKDCKYGQLINDDLTQ